MDPATKRQYIRIFAWILALTLLTAALCFGTAYGRVLDWTSAELIYTPVVPASYESDCLTVGGQEIRLSDWEAQIFEKTVWLAANVQEPAGTTSVVPAVVVDTAATTAFATTVSTTLSTTAPTVTSQTSTSATTSTSSQSSTLHSTQATTTEATGETTASVEESTTLSSDTSQTTDTTATQTTTEASDITTTTATDVAIEGLTVTMDETAAAHLTYTVRSDDSGLCLILRRRTDTVGLEQAEEAIVHVQWQDREGTFSFRLLPYGDAALSPVTDEVEDFSPTPLSVSAGDVIDPAHPVLPLQIDHAALSGFTVSMLSEGEAITKVRFSLDGGQTYVLLYDTHCLTVTAPYPEGWDGVVLLDFGQALMPNAPLTVSVQADGCESVVFTPTWQPLPEATDRILQATRLPHTIEFSASFGSLQPQLVRLERLTETEEGNLSYQEDSAFTAELTENGIVLSCASEKALPPSGSYRLVVHWRWNTHLITEQFMYFFVNTN